jgi:hypothetical protein
MSPGMLVDSRIIADSLIDLFRTVHRLHGNYYLINRGAGSSLGQPNSYWEVGKCFTNELLHLNEKPAIR